MSAFLLKINGDTRCPGGVNIPATADDWASGLFSSTRTKSQMSVFAGGAAGQRPEIGDTAYVWINEKAKNSHGRGLTAVAVIEAVSEDDNQYNFTMRNLVLLKNKISMDRALATLPDSLLIKEIARLRRERTWALTTLDVKDLEVLISSAGGLKEGRSDHPIQQALVAQASEVDTAIRKRRDTTIKARPGQSAFRQVALERHGGHCVFTRNRVAEVLEAAHVIPHTGAPEFERPDNCLLLRRDVHALFDLFLLSVDPLSGEIRVASALNDSMYAKLAGRVVDHQLARPALDFHAKYFNEMSAL